MKTFIHSTLILVVCSSFAASQEPSSVEINQNAIRAIGPLPEDKTAEPLAKGERNPFAQRTTQKKVEIAEGDSEDARLKKKLDSLPISGVVVGSAGAVKVMMGNKLLAEGDRLDPILSDQTALLRVSKVTEKMVEISWVGELAGSQPFRVIRQIRVGEPIVKQISKDEVETYLTPNGLYLREKGAPLDAIEGEESPLERDTGTKLNNRVTPSNSSPGTKPGGR
jgi:hypothetical protein